jgi:hypothetical protein
VKLSNGNDAVLTGEAPGLALAKREVSCNACDASDERLFS